MGLFTTEITVTGLTDPLNLATSIALDLTITERMNSASPFNTATNIDPNANQPIQPPPGVEAVQAVMESCPGKFVASGVAGFFLGGAFGLLMASLDYGGPSMSPETSTADLSTKQQVKLALRDMGRRTWSSAKNFAVIGAVFSGTECIIESYRAKNDLYNGAMAGCFTGGVLAARAGPQAVGLGCAGFAAFSTAIEWWLRREPSD
ncbi:uncharacterized protein VTP21DRAFT_9781 [Calcarisporiella thermophila]|uniref:uncharacterized protein n=1 Tax=Calcarisporiella thermophila TaxID=911321 RepID=UPI003743971E